MAESILFIHFEPLQRALLEAFIFSTAKPKNPEKLVHLIVFLFPFVIFKYCIYKESF